MKIRKFAAALLALVLCLSLSLPAAFAATEQRVELKNLTVNVKCTGNAIPDEQLTIRLTPRKKAPMPGDAAALEAFVNTADCTRSNGYMTTAIFPETFVFTAPGTYEYEVAQLKGSSLNGTYDTRTMVLRVTVSWSGDTLVAVAKVYDGTFSEIGGVATSLGVNDTFNNSAPDDPYDPPYIPDIPYPPDPKPTPVVPAPETPVNPPVLDARPETTPTVPAVPVAETPVNPPVADARAPKLIQTGQLNWPVPVLAGLGTLFLAAGVILLTKKKEDDNA
mgnify:CR=1 FL=1